MRDGNEGQTQQDSAERSMEQMSSSDLSNTPPEPNRRLTEGQQVDAIAEMLQDRTSPSSDAPGDPDQPDPQRVGGDGGGGAGDAAAVPEPLTPKQVAEKLDMSPDELYKMQLTVGDDQITLGELKDSFANRAATAAETQEKLDAISDRESGLVTDIQALGVLDAMQKLPKNLRDQANNHLVEMAQREYRNFITLHPEMQTDSNRIAFEKDIDDVLGGFGLKAGQFPVRTVGMYRMLKDYVDLKKADKARRSEARKAPKSAKPKRAKPKNNTPSQPKRGGAIQGQIDQIAHMMANRK